MKSKYFALSDITEARRDHDHDIVGPKMLDLINMYIAASDLCPTLRNDLKMDESDLIAQSSNIDGSPGLSDFLNYAVQLGDGVKAYFSSLVPYVIESGSAVIKSQVYDDGGTVSGTISTSIITGTNTAWLRNVWAGCQITIGSETYYVDTVDSDTQITIRGSLESSFTGLTYGILLSHNNDTAQWKISLQLWNNRLIYQPVRMDGVDEDQMSGPFQNVVAGLAYDWNILNDLGDVVWKFDSSSVWFRTQGVSIYYTTDPNSWTSAAVIGTQIYDLCKGASTFALVADGSNVWESTDLTGSSWVHRTSTPTFARKIASNGIGQWIAISESFGTIWSSSDLSFVWIEEVASGAPDNQIIHNGTKYLLVGDSRIWESTDGSTWDNVDLSGTSLTVIQSVASSGTIDVAVGKSGVIFDNGDGWKDSTLVVNNDFDQLFWVSWSGLYFFVCGQNEIHYSTDGNNWLPIDSSSFGSYNLLQVFANDDTASNLLIRTSNQGSAELRYGDLTQESFSDFYPVSNDYRSIAFTIVGAYLLLAGVSEWDSDQGVWVHYPRRVMWPSPGTVNNFGPQYEGSGFLECPGTSKILNVVTVNETAILIESDGLGIIRQTGNLNSWFEYYKYHYGPRCISSPLVLSKQLWYVGSNGKMYQANESSARQAGQFDLERYIDFLDRSRPTWLDYDAGYNSFSIYRKDDEYLYLAGIEQGNVSKHSLPLTVFGVFAFKVIDNDDTDSLLYVNYLPISDLTKTVSSYYSIGELISGDDEVDQLTYDWYGMIHTGENRLSQEGIRITTKEIEFKTYSDGGDGVTYESRGERVNPGNTKEWQRVGDDYGITALTSSTCLGTDTRWSYKVDDGDNLLIVFNLPVRARICRIYRDTVLLVRNTDYTITGNNQITLSSPLLVGEELFAYYDYTMIPKPGDFILGEDNVLYEVQSIDNFNSMTLVDYPSSSMPGLHYSVFRMADNGDGKLPIGLNAQSNELELRIYIIPLSTSTVTKLFGYLITYELLDRETRYDKPG